jgi:Spy/CpxP family protein refolding chaperone
MKRTFFALLLAFVSMTAFAQRPDANMTVEQRAENQTKTLTENLKLSEDQQKQVHALSLARAQKMQELRDSQTQDRSQMRASMETFNTELAKILTVEQQEKYKTMLEDRRGGDRRANGGGRGPKN